MKAESEILESYWSVLRFLSDKLKSGLVERLQKSLSQSKLTEEDRQIESFGAWEGTETDEKLIQSIYEARHFNRNTEGF
jgi:hypothetical protein